MDLSTPDPDQALQAENQRAADGITEDIELEKKLRAEQAARDAKTKALNETQTKGRLLSTYTNPNENPTPGADYGKSTPADLKNSFDDTQANTTSQFQNNTGVVGPTGSENNWFFNQFNTTTNPDYGPNQDFAANHDMQATDADMQAKTWEQRWDYNRANVYSATAGMSVLKATGDPKKALKVTKKIFKFYGFSVRNDYYSGGGASGSW
jgi:hypothetical protein